MLFRVIFFAIVALKCSESAKILGVFPSPGVSHYILASKLMNGLAEAGHDVTMISPYKLKNLPKNGNFTDIVLGELKEDSDKLLGTLNFFEMHLLNPIQKMKVMIDVFISSTNKTLHHSEVKKLLQSNQKFDAVILEQFNNDALKVFAHIYNCPLIILSIMGPNAWVNPLVGNPQPVSSVPHMFVTESSNDFTLLFRIKNLLFHLLYYFLMNYYMFPKHEEIMHQAFPDSPPLFDLYTNVSLVLLNSHTSLWSAVPLVPNMIEIGGYFIDPPKALPQDLQDFLDSAKEGAIYFSMGTNLRSKDMPEYKKKAILNILGKLKQKVLWKFEEDLPGRPSNVMIKNWLPQQDILAHPNVKLFITHGGLLSTSETIYHGVPIFAIPVFGDQPANAAMAVASGYAVQLGYNDANFTEEQFGALLDEVLNNPKYTENVQRRSKIFHDRQEKPMETAVYWVEYIIRHKGAPHLRVAGVRMPWYQYFMVDVIGVLTLSILIILYSLKLVFKAIFFKNKYSDKDLKKQKMN